MNNSLECFKALLYNFWIVKDNNSDMYYEIKYNQTKIKDFVSKNLGSNLIIHNQFIKLEKVPSYIQTHKSIDSFTSVLDYVILSIILLFLEDKARGDIFILSDLIEYIKNTSITLELNNIPDWNKIQNRKSLINVINLLTELSVIKVKDEEKISFIENKNSEALYEVTGISNYVMRLFDNEIVNINEDKDFLKREFINQDNEKGDVRRYKVFRDILFLPSSSMKDLSNSEVDYIKKNRNYIKNEILKNLDMEVEITNNMAILYDDTSSLIKDNFPNMKKITEIVLMVNNEIYNDILNKVIEINNDEIIIVNKRYLELIIKKIKNDKIPYLGKTYEKYTFDKFYKEVTDYMCMYNFIKFENDLVYIYPSISRMIGITKEVNRHEQINLEGIDEAV